MEALTREEYIRSWDYHFDQILILRLHPSDKYGDEVVNKVNELKKLVRKIADEKYNK